MLKETEKTKRGRTKREWKSISVNLTKEVYDNVSALADKRMMDKSDIIRIAIFKYLEENEGELK